MTEEQEPLKNRLRAYSDKAKRKMANDNENSSPRPDQDQRKIEETMEGLTGCDKLERLITNLTTAVGEIKKDIIDLKGNKDSISSLDTNFKTEQEKLTKLTERLDKEEFQSKLLTAVVIKQDNVISELKKEIETLKKGQRKPNMFISGIIEVEDESKESRKAMVANFFKGIMEINKDIPIVDAFRIGKGNPRVMKIVLANPYDKGLIFKNSSNLQGKKNAKRKLYFINDDQSEMEREERKYMQQLKKENELLADGEKMKIKLHHGKLIVNNETVKPPIMIPFPVDILTMDGEEINEALEVKTYEGESHAEQGSDFICHYQKVRSIDEIQQGLVKMKIKYGDASHIVTAYRLENALGPYNQSFLDDGEAGAGRRILATLQKLEAENLAVYIIRYFGGRKLGLRRFDIYCDLAKKAVSRWRTKQEKLARSHRASRSGTQLSQLSIASSVSETELEQYVSAESNSANAEAITVSSSAVSTEEEKAQ